MCASRDSTSSILKRFLFAPYVVHLSRDILNSAYISILPCFDVVICGPKSLIKSLYYRTSILSIGPHWIAYIRPTWTCRYFMIFYFYFFSVCVSRSQKSTHFNELCDPNNGNCNCSTFSYIGSMA